MTDATDIGEKRGLPDGPQPAMLTETSPLEGLATWLAERWCGAFEHGYAISRHRAWDSWRALHPESPRYWSCRSLAEARKNYSWTPHAREFGELGRWLRGAIDGGSERDAKDGCLEIFKWGGVALRPDDASRLWVERCAEQGLLTGRIADAVALLQPDCHASVDRFDGRELLMNSALTKVYAAADKRGRIIMYDGRVGAALGLLVRCKLEDEGATGVPAELSFRWGRARGRAGKERTRDPSTERFRFPELPYSGEPHAHQERAALSRRANQLCEGVCARLALRGVHETPQGIEQALFMVGYNVRPGTMTRPRA